MSSNGKFMIKCKHDGCIRLIPDPASLGEGEEGKRHECGACRNKIYRRRKKEAALAALENRGDAEELALLKIAHQALETAKNAEILRLTAKNEDLEEKLSTLRLEHDALMRSYRILSESVLSKVVSWNSDVGVHTSSVSEASHENLAQDLNSSFSSLALSPNNPRAPKSEKCKVCKKKKQRPPGSCGAQVKNPCVCE